MPGDEEGDADGVRIQALVKRRFQDFLVQELTPEGEPLCLRQWGLPEASGGKSNHLEAFKERYAQALAKSVGDSVKGGSGASARLTDEVWERLLAFGLKAVDGKQVDMRAMLQEVLATSGARRAVLSFFPGAESSLREFKGTADPQVRKEYRTRIHRFFSSLDVPGLATSGISPASAKGMPRRAPRSEDLASGVDSQATGNITDTGSPLPAEFSGDALVPPPKTRCPQSDCAGPNSSDRRRTDEGILHFPGPNERIPVDSEDSYVQSELEHILLSFRPPCPPSPPDKYVHFTLAKCGIDTFSALRLLSGCIPEWAGPGFNTQRFTTYGLKDKRGVTWQRVAASATWAEAIWEAAVTLEQKRRLGCTRREEQDTEKEKGSRKEHQTYIPSTPDDIQPGSILVGDFAYRDWPLRSGASQGNRFNLVFRCIDPAGLETFFKRLQRAVEFGIPNKFGSQRFGTRRIPTDVVGEAVARGQFLRALRVILEMDVEQANSGAEGGSEKTALLTSLLGYIRAGDLGSLDGYSTALEAEGIKMSFMSRGLARSCAKEGLRCGGVEAIGQDGRTLEGAGLAAAVAEAEAFLRDRGFGGTLTAPSEGSAAERLPVNPQSPPRISVEDCNKGSLRVIQRHIMRDMQSMYYHAFQSALFNRALDVVTREIRNGCRRPELGFIIPGDYVQVAGGQVKQYMPDAGEGWSGAIRELPMSGELEDAPVLHLPLIGWGNCRKIASQPPSYYANLREYARGRGVDLGNIRKDPRSLMSPGTYRPAFTHLRGVIEVALEYHDHVDSPIDSSVAEYRVVPEGAAPTKLDPAEMQAAAMSRYCSPEKARPGPPFLSVGLRFSLPPSSYATEVALYLLNTDLSTASQADYAAALGRGSGGP